MKSKADVPESLLQPVAKAIIIFLYIVPFTSSDKQSLYLSYKFDNTFINLPASDISPASINNSKACSSFNNQSKVSLRASLSLKLFCNDS